MLRLAALLVLVVAGASATNFRNCTDGRHGPHTVTVSGCDVMPCDFVQGTELINDVAFVADISSYNATPVVMVTILGLTIKHDIERPDACADLTWGGCPLDPGENATYHLVMPILRTYPLVSMTIEFSLVNEMNKTVVCLEMEGRVVNGP